MREWDLRTNRITLSALGHELLSLPVGEDAPSIDLLFQAILPEDRPAIRESLDRAFRQGTSWSGEFRVIRPDGTLGWMTGLGKISRNQSGAASRMTGIYYDTTRRKRMEAALRDREAQVAHLNHDLEQLVEARTAALRSANQELEAFTFATSHDLRAPLGRINAFSAMLEQRYRDTLEGDGLVFLDFIRQNTTRLMGLVDALLEHARASQAHLELQSIDIRSLVQGLLQDKSVDIEWSEADVRTALAPGRVMADCHALRQAVDNLLENALKYADPGRPLIIEIGGREAEGRFLLWIRDNGIGFDMAYHDRIFEIFRRLHTYSQYEGNGIGLALVKRAMERMGGRVWAESALAQGSTFFLELQLAGASRLDIPSTTSP